MSAMSPQGITEAARHFTRFLFKTQRVCEQVAVRAMHNTAASDEQ